MNSVRRLVLVSVLVLAMALTASAALAENVRIADSQPAQTGSTPLEICEAAMQEITEPEKRTFDAAEDVLEDGVDYWAILCTAAGPVYVDLFEDQTPETVNNFVFLAQNAYYNNTTFHRVLPGFMAQAGDPSGTGSGGPGYEFADEIVDDLTFEAGGLLAMANAGAGTNGSQFFVTYAATTWLNGLHTIFGEVYQGLPNAELLTPRDPQYLPPYEGDALHTVVIVDDPASVIAEPDPVPDMAHFQAMIAMNLRLQLSDVFVTDEALSVTRDAAAQAASWTARSDEALGEAMGAILADKGFLESANYVLNLDECPAVPEEMPFWSLSVSVSDYGQADAASGVVYDDARSNTLIDGGAFSEFMESEAGIGRIYSVAADPDRCTGSGMLYRLEMPYGRYVLVAESILDSDYVGEGMEVAPEQFLTFVMDQLLISTVSGPLDRGNAAVVAE